VRRLQAEQPEGVVCVSGLAENLSADQRNARAVDEGRGRRVTEDILENFDAVQEEVLKNCLSSLSSNEAVTKLSKEPVARLGQRVKKRNRELPEKYSAESADRCQGTRTPGTKKGSAGQSSAEGAYCICWNAASQSHFPSSALVITKRPEAISLKMTSYTRNS
jgi:hypothetical protein